jgi:uncharacterized protein (DUF3084 family)
MQTPLASSQLRRRVPQTQQLLVRVPTLPQDHHHTTEGEAMTEEERSLDLLIADLETENRLLRARNERLEREASTIENFKHRLASAIDAMPFGDTAASFAVFIRNFK